MRQSNSNRSRNKGRGRLNGSIVNRVFDSSGPEGKVRGNPQQIIDKYETLAQDAELSGDRVTAISCLQHAEHYRRLLTAQKAQTPRREQPSPQHVSQIVNGEAVKSGGKQALANPDELCLLNDEKSPVS